MQKKKNYAIYGLHMQKQSNFKLKDNFYDKWPSFEKMATNFLESEMSITWF